MRRRHVRAMAFAALGVAGSGALGGCGLISGADDLTVGGEGGIDQADAVVSPAQDAPGNRPTLDAAAFEASTPDAAPPGDAAKGEAGAGYVRQVTFENNSLTGPLGADLSFGNNANVVGAAPYALAGAYAMEVDKSVGGVEVDFAPLGEVYVSMLVHFNRIGAGDTTFLRLVPELGTGTVDLALPGLGTSPLLVVVGGSADKNGGSVTEAAAASAYRIGLHLRSDLIGGVIEVFLASGASPAFGAPVVTTSGPALGRMKALRVGIIGGGNLRFVADNLDIASTSMPGP